MDVQEQAFQEPYIEIVYFVIYLCQNMHTMYIERVRQFDEVTRKLIECCVFKYHMHSYGKESTILSLNQRSQENGISVADV